MTFANRVQQYIYLLRLDKPIGILLLLWPTLWALWLAGGGVPDHKVLMIFIAGVILMRSAGCILNDIADRNFDPYVERTRERPLASGKISVKAALLFAALLLCCAFILVWQCNALTIYLSLVGVVLAALYPFLKRITHLPQLGLGMAFSWGIPMAFAALTGKVGFSGWFLFLTALIWPVIYDTLYAMVDRDDDRKIGVKSTALLFQHRDKAILFILQCLFVTMLFFLGFLFKLSWLYNGCLLGVIVLFGYQQWLIKDRDKHKCFQAFLNNNWIGLIIFNGILLSYL